MYTSHLEPALAILGMLNDNHSLALSLSMTSQPQFPSNLRCWNPMFPMVPVRCDVYRKIQVNKNISLFYLWRSHNKLFFLVFILPKNSHICIWGRSTFNTSSSLYHLSIHWTEQKLNSMQFASYELPIKESLLWGIFLKKAFRCAWVWEGVIHQGSLWYSNEHPFICYSINSLYFWVSGLSFLCSLTEWIYLIWFRILQLRDTSTLTPA